jgi:heme/copper-type cytochrome/quinol oxidase subunit 3
MSSPSEKLPLGLTVPSVRAGAEIPPESADVGARVLRVASRMLCGASTFFFLAFLFAYFYLRSIDANHMWHPAHVHPNQGLGAAFIVCVVLSAAVTTLAARRMKAKSAGWLAPGIAGVVLGLVAIVLQCIEFTVQHFGPTNGAYASVFCSWSAFYLIAVLFTMYWLETQVATEVRARRTPAGSEGDIKDPDLLIAPALEAAAFYWGFLAAIGVITYVTLYLL